MDKQTFSAMDSVVIRLKIPLRQSEYSALLALALENRRNPEQQLLWLLQQEIERQQARQLHAALEPEGVQDGTKENSYAAQGEIAALRAVLRELVSDAGDGTVPGWAITDGPRVICSYCGAKYNNHVDNVHLNELISAQMAHDDDCPILKGQRLLLDEGEGE